MPKTRVSCVAVVPVGPKTETTFLNDTLRSLFENLHPDSKVLVIDNTDEGLDRAAIYRRDDIDFLRCESVPGADPVYGGLYFNLSKSWRHVLDTYDFDVVLRLDDDALVIGPGADRDAAVFFADHPDVGCLGSYHFTCTGARRDFTPARRALRSEASLMGALRRPRRWTCIRRVRRLARRHGYEDGEHCLGAAAFYSRACIERLRRLDFLERPELRSSHLGEDHIFGMMVRATGLKMGDFATAGRPLGLAWQGLPASPATLVGMGKKIVHSVKSFQGRDQRDIRAEFRRLSRARRRRPDSRAVQPVTRRA
jgi:hypothetical protein